MSTTTIARILDQSGPLAFPGVYDALSARIAERAGFPLGFVSGYCVAATMLGEPDVGLLTQTEMIHRARHVCRSVKIPILVDADTGYGSPLNVHRTVSELIDAGAAGCFLEDQVWPKRCGHMRGKRIVDRDEYLNKMRAAVDARAGRDFFIVARTDALAIEGMEEAVARVEAARDLGADAGFVEAPHSVEQLTEIGRRLRGPAVANMIGGGRTPVLPLEQLGELGFHLVLYPLAGIFSAAAAMETTCRQLRQTGTTPDDTAPPMTFDRFNELVGLDEKLALDERFSE